MTTATHQNITYNESGHLIAFGVNLGTLIKTEAEREWAGTEYAGKCADYMERARVHADKLQHMQDHPIKYHGMYGVMVDDHMAYHRNEVAEYVKLARKANRVSLAERYCRRHNIRTCPHI